MTASVDIAAIAKTLTFRMVQWAGAWFNTPKEPPKEAAS